MTFLQKVVFSNIDIDYSQLQAIIDVYGKQYFIEISFCSSAIDSVNLLVLNIRNMIERK